MMSWKRYAWGEKKKPVPPNRLWEEEIQFLPVFGQPQDFIPKPGGFAGLHGKVIRLNPPEDFDAPGYTQGIGQIPAGQRKMTVIAV